MPANRPRPPAPEPARAERSERGRDRHIARRIGWTLAALIVLVVVIVVVAVLASNNSSTVVHYQQVVGNNAQSAINSLENMISRYTKG